MFRYRLLLLLLSPLLVGYSGWQASRHRSLTFLLQRLGLAIPTIPPAALWFHAASVGEVNAVLPLVASLRAHHPGLPLLLTTNTPTGGETARRRLPEGVVHAQLPIDWGWAVGRFIRRTNPKAVVIVETEIWPNLYRRLGRAGVPLLIINGRLSKRTLGAPRWLLNLYRQVIHHCTALLVRSDHDRDGFIALGADPARVAVVGNIKFSAAPSGEGITPFAAGRPYVLAASTRDGEERRFIEAWLQVPERPLLIIAPRHPQRLAAIERDLTPFGLTTAVRSRGEAITALTQLYLADSLGELPQLMLGAELVFMGGSLVPTGGQNLLEPAALGKATITGPMCQSFADEARLLRDSGALLQVADSEGLASGMTDLLANPERRRAMGERAQGVVDQRRDMVERYRKMIATQLAL